MSILKPLELELDIISGKLVYLPTPNFSYRTIPEGCCMTVPEYQEMVLFHDIKIDGNLILEGDIAFIN